MACTFGQYDVLARIATGGMAQIFLARHRGIEQFQRVVCLKTLLPEVVKEKQFVDMFVAEARIAARLQHPNCINIYDFGEEQGTYYLSMEYIAGETLERLLAAARRSKRPLPGNLMVWISACIAEALHHAHELRDKDGAPLNMVHRDVSAENVMLSVDGQVKLIDFGIAKANIQRQETATGLVKGKFSYMSPEQLVGRKLDRRSDIYSLGLVLFETLVSQRIFANADPEKLVQAKLEKPPPRLSEWLPDIDPRLEDITARAMATLPQDRFQTALEMAQALREHLSDIGADPRRETLIDLMKERLGVRFLRKSTVIDKAMSDPLDEKALVDVLGAEPARESDLFPRRDRPIADPAARESAKEARDVLPPVRDSAPASRDNAPPARDNAPPARDVVTPLRDNAQASLLRGEIRPRGRPKAQVTLAVGPSSSRRSSPLTPTKHEAQDAQGDAEKGESDDVQLDNTWRGSGELELAKFSDAPVAKPDEWGDATLVEPDDDHVGTFEAARHTQRAEGPHVASSEGPAPSRAPPPLRPLGATPSPMDTGPTSRSPPAPSHGLTRKEPEPTEPPLAWNEASSQNFADTPSLSTVRRLAAWEDATPLGSSAGDRVVEMKGTAGFADPASLLRPLNAALEKKNGSRVDVFVEPPVPEPESSADIDAEPQEDTSRHSPMREASIAGLDSSGMIRTEDLAFAGSEAEALEGGRSLSGSRAGPPARGAGETGPGDFATRPPPQASLTPHRAPPESADVSLDFTDFEGEVHDKREASSHPIIGQDQEAESAPSTVTMRTGGDAVEQRATSHPIGQKALLVGIAAGIVFGFILGVAVGAHLVMSGVLR